MHGEATKLRQVDIRTSNGEAIHVSVDPNIIEPGVILSPVGEIVTTERPTLMNRLDSKGAEKITLSKGTLWFVGVAFVLLQVAFSYGSSILGWARDDQSQKEQMQTIKIQQQETRNDMKELKTQFDAIQTALQKQEVQAAKTEGYKLGVVETQADHGKKVK